MWIGDAIYFVSDRDGTLNLYSLRPRRRRARAAHAARRRGTCAGPARTTAGRDRLRAGRRAARLRHDGEGRTRRSRSRSRPTASPSRPSRVPAEKKIEDFGLSPKGERALFVARGDVFTAPIEKGPTRNLTHSSNAHDKHARWSPDGTTIAFVSDRDGRGADLARRPGRLRQARAADHDASRSMLYAPAWSPDGKRIAFCRQGREALRRRPSPTRRSSRSPTTARRRSPTTPGRPTARYLAFSLAEHNGMRVALRLERRPTARLQRVTDELFDVERARLGPRGQVPLLPLRPRVRAADLRHRVELRRQPRDRHLRPGPAQGRREPVRAARATR